MIICRVCGIEKPVSRYYLTPAGNPKRKCKDCEYDAKKSHRAKDPEKWKAQRRAAIIRFKYGIEPEQYESLLSEQGGACAVCRQVVDYLLHVDHDHSCCPGSNKACGKCVRGLLCVSCNGGLGMFKDSPEALRAAINYLEWGRVRLS
jgi:hypothetical protein